MDSNCRMRYFAMRESIPTYIIVDPYVSINQLFNNEIARLILDIK